jgi:hypothetical protein
MSLSGATVALPAAAAGLSTAGRFACRRRKSRRDARRPNRRRTSHDLDASATASALSLTSRSVRFAGMAPATALSVQAGGRCHRVRMGDYLNIPVDLDLRFASFLEIHDQPTDKYVHAAPRAVALAVADITRLRPPTTPQGVETLCELVRALQAGGLLDSSEHNPALFIGGTMDTGLPIDPKERLTDCVIAAADLGMFEPVPALTPEQEKTRPGFMVVSNHHDSFRDELPWPIIEGLEGDKDSEFSPIGGHWIAARKAAYDRLGSAQSDLPRSTHAQFLLDLDYFIGAIVDLLVGEMNLAGVIDTNFY